MNWTLFTAALLLAAPTAHCCPRHHKTAISPDDAPRFGEVGTRWIRAEGGYGPSLGSDGQRMRIGSLGFEHFVRDGLSLGLSANAMHFGGAGRDTDGGSLQVVVRWHPIPDAPLTPYAHLGGGGIVTEDPVPHAGTRYNFSSDLGLGVAFRTGERVRLTVGGRWNHISNASLGEHNPGRDTLYGHTGLDISF